LQDPGAPAPREAVPPQPGAPAAAPLDQPAPPPDTRATIEQTEAAEHLARQQLTNDVDQRLQAARELMNLGQPEAALSALRLAQNVIRPATNVPEPDRQKPARPV